MLWFLNLKAVFSLEEGNFTYLFLATGLKLNRLVFLLYFIDRNETFIVTVIKYKKLVVFGDSEPDTRSRDVQF